MNWFWPSTIVQRDNNLNNYTNNQSRTQQVPRRRGLCRVLRRNFHWKCFLLTLMIDGCLGLVVYCEISQNSYSKPSIYLGRRRGVCDQGYNFIPIAFSIMLYVVYVMECWHCRTRNDLSLQVDVESVYDYIRQARDALPIVWWRAVCYHYIRRTRQVVPLQKSKTVYSNVYSFPVTRYRNGDAITTTQVYYERINSHTSGTVFLYHECGIRDITKKLINLEKHPVTKIRFTKGFVFANLQAANEFEEQRARFFQENEQRDDYMEVREGLDLSSTTFKESMVCFADPDHRPWYTHQWTFWCLSLCLSSWPLRVLIEYNTAHVHFQVTKLFGTNYLSPSSQNYTGPLTRASTMDSVALENALRDNWVIVPSYSEALLMDPVNGRSQVVHDRQGNVHIQSRQKWSHRRRDSDETLCNERIIPNYGALLREGVPLFLSQPQPKRSKSLSLLRNGSPKVASEICEESSTASSKRESEKISKKTPRSFSIGSLSHYGRPRPFRSTLPMSPEESESLIPEEPPPPYDVALQMCNPFYKKLIKSTTSLSQSVQHTLGQLKHSTSRELTNRVPMQASIPVPRQNQPTCSTSNIQNRDTHLNDTEL